MICNHLWCRLFVVKIGSIAILFQLFLLNSVYPEMLTETPRQLIEEQNYREAIRLLRPIVKNNPEAAEPALLLTKAYMLEGNPIWALRILHHFIERMETANDILLWRAWIEINIGELDQAKQTLGQLTAHQQRVVENRKRLFTTWIDGLEDHFDQAAAGMKRLREKPVFYPEDKLLFQHICRNTDPVWTAPFLYNIETQMGYSTEPIAALPEKPPEDGEGSPFYGIRAAATIEPYFSPTVRPLLYMHFDKDIYPNNNQDAFGTLSFDARIGGVVRLNRVTIKPVFHYGAFRLDDGAIEMPRFDEEKHDDTAYGWLYEFNRFDIDVVFNQKAALFGGCGKRTFRFNPKTRTEADFGVFFSLYHSSKFDANCIFSVKKHWAEDRTYNLDGETFLCSALYKLNKYVSLNVDNTVYYDTWQDYASESRADITVNSQVALTIDFNKNVWLSFAYEYEHLESDIDEEMYDDNRYYLKAGLRQAVDPLPIKIHKKDNHVEIPYEFRSESGRTHFSRVRELLEHRKNIRTESSCISR